MVKITLLLILQLINQLNLEQLQVIHYYSLLKVIVIQLQQQLRFMVILQQLRFKVILQQLLLAILLRLLQLKLMVQLIQFQS